MAAAFTSARIRSRRLREIRNHIGSAQAALVAFGGFERDGLRGVESMTRGDAPCGRPKISTGTTSSPYSSTTECTGLTNSALCAPHRMRLAMGRAAIAWVRMLPSNVAVAAPRSVPRNCSQAPFSVVSFDNCSTATPQLLAKAVAACVGAPCGVEGIRQRRPTPLDLPIGLILCELLYPYGQPPRRRKAVNLAVCDSRAVDALGDALGERVGQSQQGARREFLGAQLEQ